MNPTDKQNPGRFGDKSGLGQNKNNQQQKGGQQGGLGKKDDRGRQGKPGQ